MKNTHKILYTLILFLLFNFLLIVISKVLNWGTVGLILCLLEVGAWVSLFLLNLFMIWFNDND